MAQAFASFASQRPRPAYLEIPLDLLKQPAGDGWHARPLPRRAPPQPEPRLTRPPKRLAAAKQPVIILGGGALDAARQPLRIAEALGAPILTTTAGKGAVPGRSSALPRLRMTQPAALDLLRRSDAILCVGSELSETDFWSSDVIIDKNLIRIDIDAAAWRARTPPRSPFSPMPKPALDAHRRWACRTSATDPAQASRSALRDDLATKSSSEDQLRQMLRQRPRSHSRQRCRAETIIASDMTQIAYAANEIFPVDQPRTWLHPVGFGTLGFALPAGIGAKFGRPETPVAVMIGDYGLQYTINELGTAAEHKLPVGHPHVEQ